MGQRTYRKRGRDLRFAVLGATLATIVMVVGVAHVSPVGAAGTWTIVASPNPPSATRASLAAMACPMPTDCVAVGSSTVGGVTRSLSEQFDGTNWTIVASPNPVGATATTLGGVSCPVTTICIAVGSATIGNTSRSLAERFDGTNWTIVASANPAGASRASLPSVACLALSSCIAVGWATIGSTTRTLTEKYNGTGWAIVASANPASATMARFTAVTCPSMAVCIGVGTATVGGTGRSLVERFNGTSWTILASANPAGASVSVLAGVTCPSTTICFAVGSATVGTTTRSLTEKYSGTWTIVASPNPANATSTGLNGLRCQTTTACVAVGSSTVGGTIRTLSEKYNDTSSSGTLFADQFNAGALDTSHWTALNRPGDSSNSEAQCYKPANVTEGGGSLVITSKADTSCNGFDYTSGMIQWTTFNFTYGTVEFRAKFAGGQGTWPAVWMLGSNCQASNILSADNTPPCNWPQIGSEEIDIAEIMHANTSVVSEGLFARGGNFGTCTPSVSDVSTNWHTYDLVWAPGSLTWKIDGVTKCHMTNGVPSTPMFLMINTAVGGIGGGTIDPATLPQTSSIDYVTVTR